MDAPLKLLQKAPAPVVSARRYAVILAGGTGTRLWPLSRSSMPKQLLALNGSETLLQQTVKRVAPLVDATRVITVTHADHRFEVMGQLHAIDVQLADGAVRCRPKRLRVRTRQRSIDHGRLQTHEAVEAAHRHDSVCPGRWWRS